METQDGTRVTLWSATQGMFLSTVGGGGSDVVANQGEAKDWETLRLWRMKDSDDMFMIRVHDGQFVGLGNNGRLVAVQTSPGQAGKDDLSLIMANRWTIELPMSEFAKS
ncbi:hypothetical protein ZWY2020_027230 [Hordeum vulgare]|nr:hypothetical protein ZWY2020_027230 [Hordeum vulgare]